MRKTNTMKLVYLSIGIIFCLMLILQVVIMAVNSRREAKNTTNAYLVQTESILDNNEREEEALIASLKEDYIVLAKAVAYYLDNCPSAVNDFSELNKICDLMSIDEIHIFNDQGVIVSSSVEEYVGYSFDSGEQIGYFKPMLSNKDLTMCQDATPNTAEGKPMMYAITWNEAGSQMVQIGIEPVRLFEELEKNEVSEIIKEISLDKNMAIIIANAETLDIVGSTIDSYDGKGLEEVSSLTNKSTSSSFITSVKLSGKKGNYFCRIDVKDEYCICVLQSHMPFSD